jgi:hypothetical protein
VRNDVYNSVLSAYGSFDRMARYSDFSEMEATPEIAAALDIYSEETVAQDDKGVSLHIYSDNRKIRELLETLFYDTLNVGFNLPMWVRNLCKYGDFFMFLDVDEEYGVINAYPIPIAEMEREEGYDPDDPMSFRFRWLTRGNTILENWQVAHFRLLGNDAFLPYGTSVLESARRIWRQLILMEDAMLVYRVIRAPERRVFYIDVGNVPPTEIANYMEQAKDSLKRQPIVDKTDGRVDLRYNPYPVWEESVIPLLDGRNIAIKELAEEYDAGKENWVYSVQDETQRLVPGKVVWCGKNYEAKKLTRVWLDDGTWVMTAPEHPFLLRDGTSLQADQLEAGQALMPFYRKSSAKNDGWQIEGYPVVYDPAEEADVMVHRRVANAVLREQREEIRSSIDWEVNNNLVVHHKNFNSLDASPNNLRWMGNVDHWKYHASIGRKNLIEYNKSEAKRKKTSEDNRKYCKAEKMGAAYNGSKLHQEHNEIRRKAQLKSWKKDSNKRKKAMRTVVPDEVWEFVVEGIKANPKIGRAKLTDEIRNNDDLIAALKNANTGNDRDVTKFHVNTLVSVAEREGLCKGYSEFRQRVLESGYRNHKVARIEEVLLEADVYCMTVVGPNGEDDRHNFAMCSFSQESDVQDPITAYNNGLFVMNSVDEDYFIPTRGTDSGTRIDTLAGGQNTAAIEDVEYIQKKLFAALKIPRAYLGYDESIGSKATLAQEDIRFSRAIQRIQQTVVAELNKIAMIHLASAGFEGEDLIDFELRLSNPSSIAQQQKLELISTRFDIAGKAPEALVDRDWVRRNVFGMTAQEIRRITAGRVKDQEEDTFIAAATGGEGEGEEAGGGGFGGGEDLFAADVPDSEAGLLTGDPSTEKRRVKLADELEEADEDDDDLKLSLADEDSPIKADRQMRNAFGEPLKTSRSHRGPLKTHMPDFKSIAGVGGSTRGQDTSNKPFDDDFVLSPKLESPTRPSIPRSLQDFFDKQLRRVTVLNEEFGLEDEDVEG